MAMHIQIPRRTFGLFIGLLVIVAVGSLAWVYLPHATVTIHPKVTERSVEQTIALSAAAKDPDFVKFILPAKLVEKEVHKDTTVQRPADSATDDFAKGRVTLYNNQDEKQPLLPKTHLRHEASGTFFVTDSAVTIPPHSEIGVDVTAVEKGASGNVPAGKFIVDKLPETLQSEVYGESKQAFTGGVVSNNPITQAEIDGAKQDLIKQATEEAVGALTLEAGGAKINPALISTETTQEDVSAPAGSAATSFTVAVTVHARAFAVDENDLLSLTLLALKAQTSQDEEFLKYDPTSFAVSIGRADFDRGEAQVKTSLRGSFGAKIAPTVLQDKDIAGLSREETREYFKKFDSVGDADVSFWPFWVTSIPSRAGAVEITVGGGS